MGDVEPSCEARSAPLPYSTNQGFGAPSLRSNSEWLLAVVIQCPGVAINNSGHPSAPCFHASQQGRGAGSSVRDAPVKSRTSPGWNES